MKIQKLSMADLARIAGVSKNTVSAALRNHHSISRDTCERIQKLAEEHGYRPNPMVSALMSQVRGGRAGRNATTIAYLSGVSMSKVLKAPSYSRFFDGARQRAEKMGYTLDPFSLEDPGIDGNRLGRILRARGIDGVVIGAVGGDFALPGFPWDRFCFAGIGFGMREPAMHRALNDQFHGMQTALMKIKERGYRRPGLVMDRASEERIERRWVAAFLDFQMSLPKVDRIPPLEPELFDRNEFAKWFAKHRPDVILTPEDKVISWLRPSPGKWNHPDDVGFVHLNLMPYHEGLAGIRQDYEAVGAAALDLVDMQLKRNERGIHERLKFVMSRGIWIDGVSVRPPLR